jgi:hypothetical protein
LAGPTCPAFAGGGWSPLRSGHALAKFAFRGNLRELLGFRRGLRKPRFNQRKLREPRDGAFIASDKTGNADEVFADVEPDFPQQSPRRLDDAAAVQ